MKKFKSMMFRVNLWFKINLSLKRIVKRKILGIILIVYLVGTIALGALAFWNAFTVPAVKIYPQVTFAEFLQQIKTGQIEYLYLKRLQDGEAAKEFTTERVIILIKSRTDDVLTTPEIDLTKFTYTEFISNIKNSRVEGTTVILTTYSPMASEIFIFGWLKDKNFFITTFPTFISSREELSKLFSEYNVQYWELNSRTIEESNWSAKWGALAWFIVNLLVLVCFVAIANSKLRNKEIKVIRDALAINKKITFADVAGIEEAKAEIIEVLDFMKYPARFIKHGAQMPKGVLLVGPPGTGKTLLVRALANEANVPFLSVAGSEFVEKYVGVGASRVRGKFREARDLSLSKNTAVILFIDEIDALGTRRSSIDGGQEYSQTITQVLHEMDGFEPNEKVFVVGATNCPENLDPAIQRKGRFDRQIIVQLPDLNGRHEILKVHCKNKRLGPKVDLKKVAELTPLGFSGADLANVANEAAIRAARIDKDFIEAEDFEKSVEKVILGQERKSNSMSDEDKSRTAYHETGHTVVAKFTEGAMLPQKVSIVPTTKGIGGYTKTSSREDKYYWTRAEFLAQIQVLFGGRIVEELIFGQNGISTGAQDDLRRATKIAEEMICDFGMASETLGPQTFGTVEGNPYLGGTLRRANYSESTAQSMDKAKKEILTKCYQDAQRTIEQHFPKIEILAKALKAKEVLGIEEIDQLLLENS